MKTQSKVRKQWLAERASLANRLGKDKLTIRVTKADLKALDWVQTCDGGKLRPLDMTDRSLPWLASVVLKLALAHPQTLKGWLLSLSDYAKSEGVNPYEHIARMTGACQEYAKPN